MDFTSLDYEHKRHLLLNCRLTTDLLTILANALDEAEYIEVAGLINDLNKAVIELKESEIDLIINEIEKGIKNKKLVITVEREQNY